MATLQRLQIQIQGLSLFGWGGWQRQQWSCPYIATRLVLLDLKLRRLAGYYSLEISKEQFEEHFALAQYIPTICKLTCSAVQKMTSLTAVQTNLIYSTKFSAYMVQPNCSYPIPSTPFQNPTLDL